MEKNVKMERMNICFIGKTNVGKSTVINKLIGQNISIVSEQPGTTTDPVVKRYELIPVGPVSFFDTAGYDDITDLGYKRLNATLKTIFKSDLAVIVIDNKGLQEIDILQVDKLFEKRIPFFILWNKSDIASIDVKTSEFCQKKNIAIVEYDNLKEQLIKQLESLQKNENFIVKDLIKNDDLIVLVMPIDSAAPKGRIILPQAMVLREVIETGAIGVCCDVNSLKRTFDSLKDIPKLVITDSQAIESVQQIVPKSINLTTFSILFARFKGELDSFINGINILNNLKENDKVLVAETCSHNTTHEDIGRIKIPKLLSKYLGFSPDFEFVSGSDFPSDLEKFKLVIHCGGCMLTRTEILRRIHECERHSVAITNYGMVLSEVSGCLKRVIQLILN